MSLLTLPHYVAEGTMIPSGWSWRWSNGPMLYWLDADREIRYRYALRLWPLRYWREIIRRRDFPAVAWQQR